ncbi:6751_t:CDS:2 [Cetraspora pellucida]|uniref:6751_t:CDS:1 n=1 Tax=Cetraspora pellucida TaxID=1433469 RepID=A0A9N9EZN4_9GLOM|nr:6751_t:CDS:2 [Cetraspora pellucida]
MSEYSAKHPQQIFSESRQLLVTAPTSPRKENINKSSENNSNSSASMSSNNVATGCDQENFIPQLPQPQYKTSKGGNPVPSFEYLSYDRVQDLYEQNKGTLYFIPEGFEPVLVPNDAKATSVTNLLENAKPVSAAPNVPRMLPDTDVRLPSFALPCGVAAKQEHMKKYPEYRYRPRRPQERKRRIQPREDSPSAQGSTPTLPSQNLSMIDASAFFPRRVSSISTDGENSEIFTPTTIPLSGSPQQYLDSSMAKYDYSYIDDSNSFDGSPVSTAATTFVNTHNPMTTSGGMIDFSVFDASNPPAPGEAMNYLDMGEYIEAFDQYDNMASLNFISAADEQFIRNQQFVKLDY